MKYKLEVDMRLDGECAFDLVQRILQACDREFGDRIIEVKHVGATPVFNEDAN